MTQMRYAKQCLKLEQKSKEGNTGEKKIKALGFLFTLKLSKQFFYVPLM